MAILEVKNLVVNYGAIRALKGISFDVNEGEIISLIGSLEKQQLYIQFLI